MFTGGHLSLGKIKIGFAVFAKAIKWLSSAHEQICSLLFEVCLFNDLYNRWTRL